jgi:hypothetical protein
MNEREQMINFLLQSCDAKNQTIAQLQSEIAALKQQLEQSSNSSKGK